MLLIMEIGDRIRAARTRARLTQRELAERIGVDKSAVAQWEGGGGGKGIKTENLVKAARVLGILPSELLGGDTSADKVELSDAREIALIAAYRRLPEELKAIHLSLLSVQAGRPAPSEPPQQKSHPGNRQRIGG